MQIREIVTALSGVNGCSLKLVLKNSSEFRTYLSEILRRYDELAGNGLQAKSPIAFLLREMGIQVKIDERVQLPSGVIVGGGTSLGELVTLATVAQILKPKTVFEIGTYNGCATSVMLINTLPEAMVYSMDLPPDSQPGDDMVHLDSTLVKRRNLAEYVYTYKLEHRFHQILCDSMRFDPEPYRDTVQMGFVDGAHAYKYVKNDTEKMAVMMAPNGLVFWHDYGGKGSFRPLSEYLEGLGKRISMYRVPGTTMAWTTAEELRKIR